MNKVLPVVYLARHGETAWTLSGQHTGLTDLLLTERGEHNARRLEERILVIATRENLTVMRETRRLVESSINLRLGKKLPLIL